MAEITAEYVTHMGDDLSVVNAARVSFDHQSSHFVMGDEISLHNRDAKLIRYLAKHNHKSPFNHAFLSFRVKAPVVVARQLVKHEYMPWNEISRRYVKTLPEFYHPPVLRQAADNVKQGSSDQPVDMSWFSVTEVTPSYLCTIALSTYQELLRIGCCAEQARMYLPQNMMTEWVWSGSLFAFAKMLNLRLDAHTQYETRIVAELIEPHVARLFPISWEALRNDRT